MFPAQKVQLYPDESRHCKKTPDFYAVPGVPLELLFFDQHAAMVNTNDLLPGFQPGIPTSNFPTLMTYDIVASARPWSAPSPAGSYKGLAAGRGEGSFRALTSAGTSSTPRFGTEFAPVRVDPVFVPGWRRCIQAPSG